jgi:hypothetical protein
MVNKKIVTLTCIVFVVGLLIGLVSLNADITRISDKEYPVEVNLVSAYFKVFNTSADSGIAYKNLLSYILVLNVTNPSDTTLRLSDIQIRTYGTNIFSYERNFPAINTYNFNSNSSNLIAFSQTTGLDALSVEPFHFSSFMIGCSVSASFTPVQGGGRGGDINSADITVTRISEDEFVYGTFNQTSVVFQSNDGLISAWSTTGRIG